MPQLLVLLPHPQLAHVHRAGYGGGRELGHWHVGGAVWGTTLCLAGGACSFKERLRSSGHGRPAPVTRVQPWDAQIGTMTSIFPIAYGTSKFIR